jgi:hypothetical protein
LRTGAARSEPASGKKGALVIAIMDPRGNDGALAARASRRFTAFAASPHHDLPAAADLATIVLVPLLPSPSSIPASPATRTSRGLKS